MQIMTEITLSPELLREWADDFEAAARDVPRGIKSAVLMTRAAEARKVADTYHSISEPTSAWQPIETAPRDGRRLLGTGGGLDDTVEVISYNGRVGAWDTENYTLDDRDDEAEGYNRPSHWQPMPSAHVSSPVGGGE
jgi:hypothetical protein